MEAANRAPAPSSGASDPDTSPPGVLDLIGDLETFLDAHSIPEPPQQSQKQEKSKPQLEGNNSDGRSLAPAPIGSRGSQNVILLNEKQQWYNIPRPEFVFSGGSSQSWSAKTEFLGQYLKAGGVFYTKHEAKDALSGKCLEVIVRLEEEGKLKRPEKGKKKRVIGGVDANGQDNKLEKEEPFVNYIGLLIEFQRSISSPDPVYTDYALGTQFSSTCIVPGHDDPFGSQSALFPNKKAARQNAAEAAVEHFKAAGLWPETFTDSGSIKKPKKTPAQPRIRLVPEAIGDGGKHARSTPKNPSEIGNGNGNGNGKGNIAALKDEEATSNASRVNKLAHQLNLGSPAYDCIEAAVKPFYNVSCYFNTVPRVGPIGQVRNVYGRGNAKDECARLTVEWLLQLREQRRDYQNRNAKLGGGDGGQSGGTAADRHGGDDYGGNESDEFEDAEEYFKGDV